MHPYFDTFLLRAEQMLQLYGLALRSVASGFLLGRFTNEVNDQNKTVLSALKGTLDPSTRDNNSLSWIALVVALFLPMLLRRLSSFNRRRHRTDVFSKILSKYRAPYLVDLPGLAWGTSITLQSAPNVFTGWRHDEVTFDHRTQHFKFDSYSQQAYEIFRQENHSRLRLVNDDTKIWLTENPVSFLDSPGLILSTQLAKYSQCKFKEESLAGQEDWRNQKLREAIEGKVSFPHSLCFHAIITTADDRVLMTKRSNKVSYYKGCWSCSIEEQMKPEDLVPGKSVILSWTHRMLDEELGIAPVEFNDEDVRVMSVFMETDIMNVAICGCISLAIDSSELHTRLTLLPRKDYEFVDWQFMSYDELIEELRSPSPKHHGSTGYRIMFALIRRYGNAQTIENILRRREFSA